MTNGKVLMSTGGGVMKEYKGDIRNIVFVDTEKMTYCVVGDPDGTGERIVTSRDDVDWKG